MDIIVVGIADGKVVRGQDELITYALGSCVGICLYDPKIKLAGMAHILLPTRAAAFNQSNPYKFADSGIRRLIQEMEALGAFKGHLTAKLAGGAEMFKNLQGHMDIGRRNILESREVLRQENIRILSEDTGANYGRTISFSAATGALTVKSVGRPLKII